MKKIYIIISSVLIISVISLLVYVAYTDNRVMVDEDPGSFMYTDYGVYVPTGYSIYGMDVSKYQERINWKEVANMKVQGISIKFAFIKATEGKYMKDKRFKQNWKEAKLNGIVRGAYHYYLPDGNPKQQANNFIETVKLEAGDLPPVIDIETRGIGIHKVFIKNIKTFIGQISGFCKCQPIIYTYDSFYNDYLQGQFNDYPLWIARYGADKPMSSSFRFWQFTDRARIDGIGTKVDMNVFAGDSTEFAKLLINTDIP